MSCTESVLDRALLRGAGPVETTVIDEATVGGARHRKNPVTHDTDRLSEWEQDPSLRGHFVGRGPQKRTVGPAAPPTHVTHHMRGILTQLDQSPVPKSSRALYPRSWQNAADKE
ncbi:hypothetical protein BHE74_00031756 [Ensete ventricosum]|uniref:Uncharacterized protein n=1 Tax=Ensete ventricosum TaxID=4639 RepID=A0A427AWF6_ENSVE|nr:hypothetical protein B296_00004310 [Ensete ventricosum]RWW61196.1 hypothetical protein BHE74_00031756 [Ensete ventricosum]